MAATSRRDQLALDCQAVADAIDRYPGLPGKRVIAEVTGLTVVRVDQCIRLINSNETPFIRVEYGVGYAKGGPYAGKTVEGWWSMRYARHQDVMDQADEHSSLVESGVRRSRLMRLAYAKGLNTKAAQAAVASILDRLDVNLEAMSVTDYEAFEALFAEELENNHT